MGNVKFPDLSGMMHGKSIIIEKHGTSHGHRKWKIKCVCGNYYYALTQQINKKEKLNCGCIDRHINIGDIFGKGKVDSYDKTSDTCNKKVWHLTCECGNKYTSSTYYLKRGIRKDCGCSRKESGTGDINSTYWHRLLFNCKKSGKVIKITRKYAWQIFEKQNGRCALSGIPISMIRNNILFKKNSEQTASIDRIDSSKGYIKGNIQWVHKDINKMKGNLTDEYFIKLCHHVSKCNKE